MYRYNDEEAPPGDDGEDTGGPLNQINRPSKKNDTLSIIDQLDIVQPPIHPLALSLYLIHIIILNQS